MEHVDLFSGIGGFALAAHWAGLETVLFCEKEPYAQKVLKRHWPDVPIVEDIRDLTYERYVADTDRGRELQQQGEQPDSGGWSAHSSQARPFLLTGGTPCQPASVAGKRKGAEDDRWLWPEAIRVTGLLKPHWALFENPTGILSLDDGRAFEQILVDLEGIGYEVAPVVIPAAGVGAPHRRDRVWIVGHAKGAGRTSSPNRQGEAQSRGGSPRDRERENGQSQSRLGGDDDGLPRRMDEPRWPKPAGDDVWLTPAVVNATRTEEGYRKRQEYRESIGRSYVPGGLAEQVDNIGTEFWPSPLGAPQHEWEPPRVTTVKKDRANRLKGLGNAIVPQVAYQIIRAMIDGSTK